MHRSFTSSVKFIPSYFILLDAIINGIIFLISLSDISLLVYGNTTEFCILIFYPATLLNLFINSNNFVVESLGHLQIVTVLLLLFPYMLFISVFCLIAVAWTSNTMLNKKGKSRHSCFVPEVRGKAFSLSSLSMKSTVGLSYYFYVLSILTICSLYTHFVERFFLS